MRLAIHNLAGTSFRSWMVFLCAALLAGFGVSATIILRGANNSLELALERLGADIVVVPSGQETRLPSALLMGVPVHFWMPDTVVRDVASIPGVRATTPQLYLSTLRGATCCSLPEMFLIAYDPATDFTLRPWLEQNMEGGLALGEVVGGSFVYVPADQDKILVYGFGVDLKGNLEPTGTGIDQSMFMTFETAREIARLSPDQALRALDIPPNSISSALVRVDMHADPHQVAREIQARVRGVASIEAANLFGEQRQHIIGLFRSVILLLALIWILAMALIAGAFAIATNERHREIGVMRALGARRTTVLGSLLWEGALLGLAGGLSGVLLATLVVFLFRSLIIDLMGVPFLLPALPGLLALAAGALALTLASVLAAALFPALRSSVQEPALAMRE